MDEVDNPEVGELVLMWCSQLSGKTETINNIIGQKVDIDPCPILNLQPTLEMAETWSKDRFSTMLRDTPALRGRVKDPRSKDANNTILHKRFPGGHITIAGANSPASLASRPIRMVVCDEIDRYPPSAGTEGDPIALAEKRTESFPDAIKIKTSTPTIRKISKIEKAFEASDKRYWFCPCPHCQHEQTLKWGQVKWEEKNPNNAWYECEGCGAKWTDEERQAAVRAGEWRATAPFSGIRGYHLNGIYCLFRPQRPFKTRLQQMAVSFLRAKEGGKYTLMVWTNTFLAETWEDATEVIEFSDLMKRREDYKTDPIPARIKLLTCGVDVQKDRIELEVDGWADGEESWGICYRIIPGNTLQEAVWLELDQFLQNTAWKREDGTELRITAACVDSSAYTDEVYAYCKRRFARRIYAVKGSNQPGQPVVGSLSRSNRMKCPVYRIGTDTAKDIIFGRLQIEPVATHDPVGGYMHYTRDAKAGFDENYFKMLTAEEVRLKYVKGHPVREYKPKYEGARNEALDLRVYSLAALCILQPDWILLTKNLERKSRDYTLRVEKKADADAEPEPQPEKEPPKKPWIRRPTARRGFVNSWKRF